MIVREQKAQEPQRETEDEIKKRLLGELEKFRVDVLTLAYMYARGYDLCGEDITKTWANASQNNQIVEEVYRRGYQDCEKDFEEKKRRDFYHKTIVDLKE